MNMDKSVLLRQLKELQEQELEITNKLKDLEVASNASQKLTNHEIQRYSRQLLLPEWGVNTQLRISRQTNGVLVVGCGGLGCPAVQYLAAAGLSPIGIVDYDQVDVSNLHRQILHSESKAGMSKVDSVIHSVKQLNSLVKVVPYKDNLSSANALDIIEKYDVILDASDNVATRYLLNDACVLAKKPLVSGSALRFEGQLTVYNYDNKGPTYRCLFPQPPPPETVTNCSDGGVVGVVPGIIGTLQAQEALKIVGNFGQVLSGRMLLYDGFSSRFTVVKLRPRSDHADKIEKLIDYEQFCGAKATDKDEESLRLLPENDRIDVFAYQKVLQRGEKHLLVDVRTEPELEICKLHDQTINIPLADIAKESAVRQLRERLSSESVDQVICVCRRGNDSQRAVISLRNNLDASITIKDVIGGLHAWADQVDKSLPKY